LRSRSLLNSIVYSLSSSWYCLRYSLAVALFLRTWIIFFMFSGFSMLRIDFPVEFCRSLTFCCIVRYLLLLVARFTRSSICIIWVRVDALVESINISMT